MGELAKWRSQNWVRIGSDGNIKGACGTSKNKKNPDRCLPMSKAKSLSKSQRAATARKKKKAGANVFYIAKIAVDADAGIKLTKADEDTLRNFQELIDTENTEVFELYKQAKKGKATSDDAANAKVINDVEEVDPVAELSS